MWREIFRKKQESTFPPGILGEERAETTEYLSNPGQGWYGIDTYHVEIPFDPEEEGAAKGKGLVLVRLSLEHYREEPLPDVCLENVRRILGHYDKGGSDILLRVAYDFEGKGEEKEPDLFSQVRDHIRQLGPLVREFENRILVFQGLLLGSWGEMHHSKFLSEGRLRELEDTFREACGERVWLALRRPVFLRMLAEDTSLWGKRTLYDDAIGSSETDMGTFGHRRRQEASWKEAWVREDELAFLVRACARAPVGGEAVLPEPGYGSCVGETIRTLRRMHLSYLNSQHDQRILARWRGMKVRCAGVWNGASLYDYVGAHMGYRFCVRRVSLTGEENGGVCRLAVEIENTGFGDLLQEAQAELAWVDGDGGKWRYPLDWDARLWRSGSRVICRAQIPAGTGRLYLGLWRKWDRRRILFANEPDRTMGGEKRWEGYVLLA